APRRVVGKRSRDPLRDAAGVRAAPRSRRLAGEQPADPVDGPPPRIAGALRGGGARGPARPIGAADRLPSRSRRPSRRRALRGPDAARAGAARLPGLPAGPPFRAGPGAGARRFGCRVRFSRAGRPARLRGAALQPVPRPLAVRPGPGRARGMSDAAAGGAAPAKGTVVLIGAGLGGSHMSILLGKAGYAVRVFERRADPRSTSIQAGRSINLALSARGIHALERAGIDREVLAIAIPMRGRIIHGTGGRTDFQPYGTRADQVNHSV